MTVLVYHSSLTARRIFANVLEQMHPSTVRVCAAEAEFFQALDDHSPDVIIVEKESLRARGYQLLTQLRKRAPKPGSVVVAVGYQFTKDEAIEAIQHDIDELILLPFNAEEFLEKVQALVHPDI